VTDEVVPVFDAAMIGVCCFEGFDHVFRRVFEKPGDILAEDGAVSLEGKKVVRAFSDDGLGNFFLGPHGVDGHQGAGQDEAFEQKRGWR